MKYAVEQINNCSSLLPGVQLDFLFNDTKVIDYLQSLKTTLSELRNLN